MEEKRRADEQARAARARQLQLEEEERSRQQREQERIARERAECARLAEREAALKAQREAQRAEAQRAEAQRAEAQRAEAKVRLLVSGYSGCFLCHSASVLCVWHQSSHLTRRHWHWKCACIGGGCGGGGCSVLGS